MHVLPLRLEAEVTDDAGSRVESSDLEGTGRAFGLGPLEVIMELHDTGIEWSWPTGAMPTCGSGRSPWSTRWPVPVVPSGCSATDTSPGRPRPSPCSAWTSIPPVRAGFPFLQAVHHADQRRAGPGELRSEWVTVLADGWAPDDAAVLLGFDGGAHHDGTFRLAAVDDGIELRVEAHLGDAELLSGTHRPLHAVEIADGPAIRVPALLEQWADRAGRSGDARVAAPFQVGWCSWYQYFHDVSEADIGANLALADQWPFDVFQVDDGYQASIGDWLETNDRFPSDLAGLAASIGATGRTPGLWLAPFLVAPDSDVAVRHPDWIARHVVDGADTGPLRTWWNPPWGGGEDGFMYGLDTTHPEVTDHLESVAAALVEAGFPYLKLDFTFSPSVDGRYHDPTRTPAERVRAGFAAIRRGAGDDAFLLGCGVPLANVVGLVDANRIGPDVAPVWSLDPAAEMVPGYLGIQPATAHAFTNTLTRSFMHRRLWLNDPDCVMLRTEDTGLTPAAARTWAHAVGVSGGMALVSDDLGLLGADARTLLDEVLALGRAADDDARRGGGARCPDLLEHQAPGRLESAAGALDADPFTGASHLTTATRR